MRPNFEKCSLMLPMLFLSSGTLRSSREVLLTKKFFFVPTRYKHCFEAFSHLYKNKRLRTLIKRKSSTVTFIKHGSLDVGTVVHGKVKRSLASNNNSF